MTDHVFLSPHFDDAIGSCGGTMWRLRRAGHSVQTLTVFGGDEVCPLSSVAARFHAETGGVAVRRVEDARACAAVGCSGARLDFPDAIYRRRDDGSHLYPEPFSIMRQVSPDDARLAGAIADAVAARLPSRDTVLYCPMAIGGHVDHVLTRDCGLRLAERGFAVVFYVDFFYSVRVDARTARAFAAHAFGIGAIELVRKVTAFSSYRSQIPALFGGMPGMWRYFLRHGRRECLVPAADFVARDCHLKEPTLC